MKSGVRERRRKAERKREFENGICRKGSVGWEITHPGQLDPTITAFWGGSSFFDVLISKFSTGSFYHAHFVGACVISAGKRIISLVKFELFFLVLVFQKADGWVESHG